MVCNGDDLESRKNERMTVHLGYRSNQSHSSGPSVKPSFSGSSHKLTILQSKPSLVHGADTRALRTVVNERRKSYIRAYY